MRIRSQSEFLEKLKKYDEDNELIEGDFLRHNFFIGTEWGQEERIVIENQTLVDRKLRNIKFDSLHFKNCTFINCNLEEITSWSTIFENCNFVKSVINNVGFFECDLINCKFHICRATYITFSDSSLSELFFNECSELLEFYFGGAICSTVVFNKSNISHSRFEPIIVGEEMCNFIFKDSLVTECSFNGCDLRKSLFENSMLNKSVFSNCTLLASTFTEETMTEDNIFASIDFHTLNKSETLSEPTLKNVFGIVEKDIKTFTLGLSNDVNLQSVFISYSFKDRVFANRINDALMARGVLTFLWQKDAPIGRPLKRIMMENVGRYDRILFVASVNSIKSEACHFELTMGRKKQDLSWETVFFPIHIDPFLFEVDKMDIRPREKQNEYWSNIMELREIHSMDFSDYNKDDFDIVEFEKKIAQLVNDLRN